MGIVQKREKYHTSRPTGCATKAIMASAGTMTLSGIFLEKYSAAIARGKSRISVAGSEKFIPCVTKWNPCMRRTAMMPGMEPRKAPAIGAKASKRVKLTDEPTSFMSGTWSASMPRKVNPVKKTILFLVVFSIIVLDCNNGTTVSHGESSERGGG